MADVLTTVPERALAVYAHPDDPEVSCGGTLATWAASGCKVHVVIACAGDKGSSDPATDPDQLAARRSDEVGVAAVALGVDVEQWGHADGDLALVPDLRADLVGVVRRVRPDVVIGPDPTAVFFGDGYVNHVDHRTIGWALLDAVAPAAASPLYHRDRGAAHQVATLLLSGSLEPDVWVDVDGGLDAKVRALFCHTSQLAPDAGDWLADFVRSRAVEEGRRAGVALAEGFRRIQLTR